MANSDAVVDVESLWPALAGKQTCANCGAGTIIRQAWWREVAHEASSAETIDFSIRRDVVEYRDGETVLQGLYARPEGGSVAKKVPGVILAHTAVGPQEDFLLWKLDSVARLGYAAFALDMFGTGRALWDRSESLEARRPVTEDRSRMQARAMAALEILRQQPEVDPDRIAAIGYCFGGMAVLDLARLGAPPGLRAVATLHGVLEPITEASGGGGAAGEGDRIVPRVLVLHAAGDPFVPKEEVEAMRTEFEARGAKLEVVTYEGKARHAFTRPEKIEAADINSGFCYDEHADQNSWQRITEMLSEEFA